MKKLKTILTIVLSVLLFITYVPVNTNSVYADDNKAYIVYDGANYYDGDTIIINDTENSIGNYFLDLQPVSTAYSSYQLFLGDNNGFTSAPTLGGSAVSLNGETVWTSSTYTLMVWFASTSSGTQEILIQGKNGDDPWETVATVTVSLNPVEEVNYVAQIGETQYETLAAAVAAANGGDTIVLINNATESNYFFVQKNITIDLNGYTASFTGAYGIIVHGGQLTIDDSGVDGKLTCSGSRTIQVQGATGELTVNGGTIENTKQAGLAINISNTGKSVVINDGSIIAGTNGYGVQANGTSTLTINGGTITSGGWGVSLFDTATVTVNDGTITATKYSIAANGSSGNNATIIINGGYIGNEENDAGIYVPSGSLTVIDGEIVGENGIYFKSTNLDIRGGIVRGVGNYQEYSYNDNGSNPTGDALVIDSCGYPNGIDDVSISGGHFVSANASPVKVYIYQENEPVEKFITGGTYASVSPDAEYIADGYKAVEENDIYSVVPVTYVAQIGNDKYESLADAFAEATDGQTIKLLSNVALTQRLFVNAGANPAYAGTNNRYATTSENKVITLDLNGFNITSTSNIALAGGSLNITGEGTISTTTSGLAPIEVRGTGDLTSKRTLTIGENVVVDGTTGKYGINIFGSNDTQKNIIDVTINGTVKETVFVLGNLKNAYNEINIVVNGSVLATTSSDGKPQVGIALNGNADVTVYAGAVIQGESGIEVRAGSLTVNGGTITATATEYSYNPNGSGSTTKGAAIAVAQHTTKLDTEVTLNGGTLDGVEQIGVTDVNNDMSNVEVTATQSYTESSVIPEGYAWEETATAGVYELTMVAAEVNGTKYETLDEAYNAASENDVIYLLRDIEYNTTSNFNVEKSIIIDGNGYSVSGGMEGGTAGTGAKQQYGPIVIWPSETIESVTLRNLNIAKTAGNAAFLTAGARTTYLTNVDVTAEGATGIYSADGITTLENCNVGNTGDNSGSSFRDSALQVSGGSELVVKSGNYSSQKYVMNTLTSGGKITVEGGNFDGQIYVYATTNNYWDAYGQGVVTIKGGNFENVSFVVASGDHPGKIEISGGKFDADPSDYVIEGYEAVNNGDGTWTVSSVYAAQIGDTKYETLAEAIAAANEAESAPTITILKDCEVGTAYTITNPLVLTKADTTLDLNNFAITVNNNFSFVVQADGVTVTNGSFVSGENSKKRTNINSYIVVINDCDGVNLTNVTTMGGISAGGSQSDWGTTKAPKAGVAYNHGAGAATNVTFTNCNVTSGDYYAVASQMSSTVTIVSGTYTANTNVVNANISASPSVLYANFINTDGPQGYISVIGGFFNGGIVAGNKDWITVKGGIFLNNPTSFVVEGYEAVQLTDANKGSYDAYINWYEVGEKSSTAIHETVTTENYDATYTATKTVTSTDDDRELSTATSIVVNVKTVTGDVGIDNNINQYNVASIIPSTIDAGNTDDNELNVSIDIISDNLGIDTTGAIPTVTFEVHPLATITNHNGDEVGKYVVPNDQLGANPSFTIRLTVPAEILTSSSTEHKVKVTHRSSDADYGNTVGIYDVQGNATDGYYVDVTVNNFSQFELEESTEDISATAELSATLSLGDSIDIVFYVRISDTSNPSKYTVTYTFDGEEPQIKTLGTDVAAGSDERYRLVVASCAAKQMTDTVSISVKYNDTEVASVPSYSIQKYCEKKIKQNGMSTNLGRLCYAVLDYGASAQEFFGYKTNNLANANYSDIDTVYELAIDRDNTSMWYPATTGSLKAANLSNASATLNLVSQTELFFYLTPNGHDIDDYNVVVTDAVNNNNMDITKDLMSDGRIRIAVKGIPAKHLGHNFTLNVNDGEYTLSYSPINYAYKKQINSDVKLETLSKALYQYYVRALTLLGE